MNKENKKFREVERREYVDAIRQLVEFIKGLDKRAIKIEKDIKTKRKAHKEAATRKRNEEALKKKEEIMRLLEEAANNPIEKALRAEERQRAYILDYDSCEEYNLVGAHHEEFDSREKKNLSSYDCDMCQ